MDPELLGSEAGFTEASTILDRTGRAVPRLADARYRRGYAGAFDITPDWMPILDESSLRGFFIAAGMSGHGFKLAPAVGELMASLITRTPPPVSPVPFALGRFTGTTVAGTFVASYLRCGPRAIGAVTGVTKVRPVVARRRDAAHDAGRVCLGGP